MSSQSIVDPSKKGKIAIVINANILHPYSNHKELLMNKFLTTSIGRLRLLAFLEGVSLLLLVFIASPMKYFWENPILVKTIGPVHGGLFLMFVIYTIMIAIQQNWKHLETTWKVLLASFVPFGTFYVDWKILRRMESSGK